MTKQNGNRVVDIYNAVSARSEADSNRCTRFCRPLPSHSAIRPTRSIPCGRLQLQHKPNLFSSDPPFPDRQKPLLRNSDGRTLRRIGSANIQTFPESAKLPPNFTLFRARIHVISQKSVPLLRQKNPASHVPRRYSIADDPGNRREERRAPPGLFRQRRADLRRDRGGTDRPGGAPA